MSGRAIVIVPVEEQVRELDSKLFLAAHLAARGCKVILGRRDRIEESLDSFPRGIYLGMDLRAPKTYEMARLLGHRVAAWDEEAVVHYPPSIYATRRVDTRALGCISALFAWGEDNVQLWADNPVIAGATEVFKTGNPRGDMLRAETRRLYEDHARALREAHGDFILVNTNFGSINSVNPKLNLYTTNKAGESVRGKGAVGMPESYARNLYEHRVGLFNAFKQMIPAVAAAFPEAKIIVRPHPMEDWDSYKAALGGAAPNIEIIHEGSVIPWILASRLIIHNGCNTGIEAYCLGVPAIAYQPLAHEAYDSDLPNELSHRVFDRESLISAAQNVLGDKLGPAATPDRDVVLNGYVDSRDGRFAADRIAEILVDIANEDAHGPTIADREFGKYMMSDRRKRREDRDSAAADATIAHRFKGMTADMVRERLTLMAEIAGIAPAVDVRERAPNIIEIAALTPAHLPGPPTTRLKPRRYEYPMSGLLMAPRRRYRMATCLQITRVDPFIVEQMPPPVQCDAPAPKLSAGGAKWRKSRVREGGMAHLAVIPNAYASGQGGVFSATGRVIHGATHKYDPVKKYRSIVRPPGSFISRIAQTALVLDEPVAVLTSSTQGYYYHWMLDNLPRLKMVQQHLKKTPLYVAQNMAFQRETLGAFGVDPTRIIEASGQRLIRAPKLIVPCHQIMSGQQFPAWAIQFLREHLLPIGESKVRKNRRLFISRRYAAHRRVRNEDAVADRLARAGFETVLLEDLTLSEQIAAFRDAEIIVGPHGGGFTNLVFSNPGAFVVELFPRVTVDLYHRLAVAAGVDYAFVSDRMGDEETEREQELSAKRIKLRLDDYTIDPEDVIEVLRAKGFAV